MLLYHIIHENKALDSKLKTGGSDHDEMREKLLW